MIDLNLFFGGPVRMPSSGGKSVASGSVANLLACGFWTRMDIQRAAVTTEPPLWLHRQARHCTQCFKLSGRVVGSGPVAGLDRQVPANRRGQETKNHVTAVAPRRYQEGQRALMLVFQQPPQDPEFSLHSTVPLAIQPACRKQTEKISSSREVRFPLIKRRTANSNDSVPASPFHACSPLPMCCVHTLTGKIR